MSAPKNEQIYDVLIIGGGIAGCAIARDSALRDLRVALLEKYSLASGTSSKSSRLIHGGIRYLELVWNDLCRGRFLSAHHHFYFVVDSLKESQTLKNTWPDLVKPIKLWIPVYQDSKKPAWLITLGAMLYGWMGKIFAGAKAPEIYRDPARFPNTLSILDKNHIQTWIAIWDHTTSDSALVQALAKSAIRHGCLIRENTEVISIQKEKDFLYTLQTSDGALWQSRCVVNASGPWLDAVAQISSPAKERTCLTHLVSGCHIHLKAFSEHSFILRAADERTIFVIALSDGNARVGTTERTVTSAEDRQATDAEIDYLLHELNRHFPGKNFSRNDILHVDAGIRPLALRKASTKNAHQISRDHKITQDASGVLHVAGVKLTDHRRAAQKVTDQILNILKLPHTPCKTHIKDL